MLGGAWGGMCGMDGGRLEHLMGKQYQMWRLNIFTISLGFRASLGKKNLKTLEQS